MSTSAKFWAAAAAILFVSTPARAQNLSQIITSLTDVQLAPPPPGQPSHSAHFSENQIVPTLFNQLIASQLSTFPIGSSSGGFTYTFDSGLGTFSRSSASFGPEFAERALTNGRGKLTVGAFFQYSKFSTFEGNNLENGDVKFFLRHEVETGAFFEGDLIQATLKMDLTTNTTALYATYGLTDKLDVSVTVPIVHVSINASTDDTILRLATGTLPIHQFTSAGATTASFQQSGSKTGIGDVLVRGKYRFLSGEGGGLAVEVDGRLPSGDSANLLGTGAGQGTVWLIGSTTRGSIAPHFNVGYTVAGSSSVANIPNEFDYRGGLEFVASPTITVLGDIVGRNLVNTDKLVLGQTTWNFHNAAGVPGSVNLTEFQPQSGNLNLLLGAFGAKFNITGTWLLSANVLVPFNSNGFRANITPVIGLSYSK